MNNDIFIFSRRQSKSQNKHDSADHKRGACVSTQALGNWLGLDYVTCVAKGGLTAGHSAFGDLKSRNFVNVLSQAIRTTVFSFKLGADAL